MNDRLEIRPQGHHPSTCTNPKCRNAACRARRDLEAPPAAPEPTARAMPGVLSLETYSWASRDGFIAVQFRRAPGGTAERIDRMLGPIQAQNISVKRRYMQLATITHINGNELGKNGALPKPRSEAQFKALMLSFGPQVDGEYYYDENLEAFVSASEIALNPEYFSMLDQAFDLGLSPEDVERIKANVGLSYVKK